MNCQHFESSFWPRLRPLNTKELHSGVPYLFREPNTMIIFYCLHKWWAESWAWRGVLGTWTSTLMWDDDINSSGLISCTTMRAPKDWFNSIFHNFLMYLCKSSNSFVFKKLFISKVEGQTTKYTQNKKNWERKRKERTREIEHFLSSEWVPQNYPQQPEPGLARAKSGAWSSAEASHAGVKSVRVWTIACCLSHP